MVKSAKHSQEKGSIVVSILIITLFLFTVVSGLMILANSNLSRARGRILLLQAQYSAESGVDAAIASLNADTSATYAGTGTSEVRVMDNAQYRATFATTVAAGPSSNERVITSTGRVYKKSDLTTPLFSRRIEVKTERSSGSVEAGGMVSRNIIDIQSGVKKIYVKDLVLNGYLFMNKNTTELIAESVTIGGRNTGVGNCSIGGSGNLVKPATFTDPAQTKTRLRLAFNNCISPPGNTTNANFEVLANQTDIQQIQSTYIPWSQYMDNTYTNSYNNCSDWTAGTSPRTIPSAGHTKQTHYPDSSSNVSTSCGTSGDLNLGSAQYNITDNVHIRANLCVATACEPTFHNPTPDPKYIFVEGTVNFGAVQTASGSGPIILIAYGADPASKASVCPYGGAIYLGNSNTGTSAPDLYLLAVNGLCLDKTKFSTNPSVGGLSGKNVYIATSPSTPSDLGLDVGFPTSAVPVNLAWHATHYRRL